MRLACMMLLSGLWAMAQVDPEYVVPKQNPFTSPPDVQSGQQDRKSTRLNSSH